MTTEENKIELPIKFFKLNSGEDLVAYFVSETESTVIIKRPLSISIENEFESARQLISIKEWIPPIVTLLDEVEISKELLMFNPMDVKETFAVEYEDVCNFFYSVKPKPKPRREKKEGNVVPFTFGVRDDSGKVH